jgi:subtilisin family serine protease
LAVVLATVLGPGSPVGASPGNPAAAGYFSQQWGLAQIEAPAAWRFGTGAGVRIGIVDTGVDFAHPDLAGKVAAAATCMNTGGDPSQCVTGPGDGQDDNGHGTHVAGIAAAAGDGVAGVAPGATFVVAKVLDSSGSGNTDDVAAGIAWVVAHGAQVVNLSLGSDTGVLGVGCVIAGCSNSSITPAVEAAWHAGAVPVIAAGNNAGNLFGPAGYGDLDAVVVAATGPSGRMASYSSTPGNAKWGVLAPGGDDPNGPTSPTCGTVDPSEILSTYWAGQSCYATDEGTSMATPFVSGTLALLLGRGLSPQQAVTTLLATLDHSITCGAGQGCQGLVDAGAAMAAAAAAAASPSPAPTTVPGGPVRASSPAPSRRAGGPSAPSAGAAVPSTPTYPTTAGGIPGTSPTPPPGAAGAGPPSSAAAGRTGARAVSSTGASSTLALVFLVAAGAAAAVAGLRRRRRRSRPVPGWRPPPSPGSSEEQPPPPGPARRAAHAPVRDPQAV